MLLLEVGVGVKAYGRLGGRMILTKAMTRGPSAGSGRPAVKIAVTRSGVHFSASTQHARAAAVACLACSLIITFK